MIIQNVKGGYDFLPKEQKIRNYINGILKETFEEYGYLPIETSILCYFDMLAGKYDENNDILNEIYKLSDQGGRKLGLRYDLTVPFAKFIALNKNEIKLPFKRYEINKVFRDGPVKVGRDREFTQCDVDVVGLDGQMIEAELLSVYVKAFKKLNIDIEIKYNSRKLMTGLINEVGIDDNITSDVITVIDKKDKLAEEEFLKEIMGLSIDKMKAKKLISYFNYSLDELNDKFKDCEDAILREGLDELNNLKEFLEYLEIESYCIFDSSLARGQDYYTGNVFEVYEKNRLISSAIGGGGRYDKMITDFISDGEVYPAVGISFGLTCIFELLKDSKELNDNNQIDLYIIPLGTQKESLKLANEIRNLGVKVDLEMQNKKIKKSLDFANKERIPYVIILGEDEVNNKSFVLKSMKDTNNYDINMDNINMIKDIIK